MLHQLISMKGLNSLNRFTQGKDTVSFDSAPLSQEFIYCYW